MQKPQSIRLNRFSFLSILCLAVLLGLQVNLTALAISFEEKHRISFTRQGVESFLYFQHIQDNEDTEIRITEESQSDHLIKLADFNSYKEDGNSAPDLNKPFKQSNKSLVSDFIGSLIEDSPSLASNPVYSSKYIYNDQFLQIYRNISLRL